MMRYGVLILFAVLAHCALSPAGNTEFVTETEATVKAAVERLEARVTELESELKRLKHSQQRAVIGGSLLDHVEGPIDLSPGDIRRLAFLLANGPTRSSATRVDQNGMIRDARGKPVGYWGIDVMPHPMTSGPNPSR